ncbi:ABC transporter permease [Actinosynnema sp. NPDC020468]|uniref:ABC transporter permease n=1 Tax=Actinosynnema sp. NPDC020468 TaxID=3154488 RepID=UPI0033E7E23E
MSALTGTGALVRLALRRDRLLLPIWFVALVGVTLSTGSGLKTLYGTVEARRELTATADGNPAFLAMLGPLHDPSTIGGVLAWRWGVFGALLIGLMSMFLVVRHTRAEEEAGRLELVGSAVVGRHASLAAAVLVVLAADVVIGLAVAGGLIGLDQQAAGAFAFGLGFTGVGWVFAGVGAVTAQLSESSRTANSLSGGVLGLAYLLRAVGDAAGDRGPQWLTWLSPLGWFEQGRPFAGDRWWVLLLPVALTALLVASGAVLATRRDIGAGLLATRLGPARASGSLAGAFGLAWRLQRGMVVGWTVAMFVLGAVYGAVARGVEDMLGSNASLAKIITAMGGAGKLVDVYLASILGIIGLFSSIYVVTALLKARSEETDLRVEPVLATPVTRTRWLASHAVFAVVGTAVVLAAAGLGAGLVHGLQTGDAGQVPRLVGAALAQLPAAWVVAGIALALFGLFPRVTAVSWAFLVMFLVLGQLGPVLGLDRWALDLSPFTHIPKVPGADLTATPLVLLTAVALALGVAGFVGFRRRDLG